MILGHTVFDDAMYLWPPTTSLRTLVLASAPPELCGRCRGVGLVPRSSRRLGALVDATWSLVNHDVLPEEKTATAVQPENVTWLGIEDSAQASRRSIDQRQRSKLHVVSG